MGKIRTTLVKRVSKKMIRENPETFKKSFEENKKILPEIAEIRSKKLRNIIAGYLTKLVKEDKF